jgi:hypothetical protein
MLGRLGCTSSTTLRKNDTPAIIERCRESGFPGALGV